ncbi:MAG TPA: FMN-binding protein [Candidatus Krumholzibacteria bacterium]|nr:FMN-binding protein [Candidatus Krumholzibacteria bacterium]
MRVLVAATMLVLCAVQARSEVFHSRESALRMAFPEADVVEKRDLFLSVEQSTDAGRLARAPIASRLVTVYVGRAEGRPLGFAFFDTHTVRTLPETVMVVIGTDGRIAGVHALAFHEPPEYGSPPAWLHQFDGWALNDKLSLRGDIAGISGATLTAQSVTAAVRRALAIYGVTLGNEGNADSTAGPSRTSSRP